MSTRTALSLLAVSLIVVSLLGALASGFVDVLLFLGVSVADASGNVESWTWFIPISGVVIVITYLIQLTGAIGLFWRKHWAWTTSVVAAVVRLLIEVLWLLMDPFVGRFAYARYGLAILVDAGILFALYRPRIRHACRSGSATRQAKWDSPAPKPR